MPKRNPEPQGDLGDYYNSYGGAGRDGQSRGRGVGKDYESAYFDEAHDEHDEHGEAGTDDDGFYDDPEPYPLGPHDEAYYDDYGDGGDYDDDSFLDDEDYYVAPRRSVSSLIDGALTSFERLPSGWMSRFAPAAIRVGVGLIFVWYGALLLQPGLSPIDEFVRTAVTNFFDLVGLSPSPSWFVYPLGTVEIAIGVVLLVDGYRLAMAWFLLVHMALTVAAVALAPELIWDSFPHAPTAEGHYVLSNLILIAAAMTIGASGRTDNPTSAHVESDSV